MWTENLMGMVAQEFVDAAGEAPRTEFLRRFAQTELTVFNCFSGRGKNGVKVANSLLSARRPEGMKERIEEVLHESESWTVEQLLQRCELPDTHAERVSVGHVMGELGWFAHRATVNRTAAHVVYRRNDTNESEAAVAPLLSQRDTWLASELAQATGLSVSAVGLAARRLGWRPIENNDRMCYAHPDALTRWLGGRTRITRRELVAEIGAVLGPVRVCVEIKKLGWTVHRSGDEFYFLAPGQEKPRRGRPSVYTKPSVQS